MSTMKTYRWTLSIGFVGAKREGEIEIEADADPDEVEEIIREEVFNYIEWNYTEVGGGDA